MVQFLLVRPGSTDFDEQGRIKGTLDIPLSDTGVGQVADIVAQLRGTPIDFLYASPTRCAQQTAQAIAHDRHLRFKTIDDLENLDHGLWQGKRIDEVKTSQPKVFRQLQEHPETVCPPQGEPIGSAIERVREVLARLVRKHRGVTVALVVPEPLASLVRSLLCRCEMPDLWKAECEGGGWELIDISAQPVALAS
ncbi:MAG TPA: histidine phosphatase family protein [Pirellulaceae bacterium]|nr:histidine phosphatase family protein [Pirellulaceae bacterium]